MARKRKQTQHDKRSASDAVAEEPIAVQNDDTVPAITDAEFIDEKSVPDFADSESGLLALIEDVLPDFVDIPEAVRLPEEPADDEAAIPLYKKCYERLAAAGADGQRGIARQYYGQRAGEPEGYVSPYSLTVLEGMSGRVARDPQKMRDLRNSILAHGVLEPITYHELEDGSRVLYFGHGRLEVVCDLVREGTLYPGYPWIKATASPYETYKEAYLAGLHINTHRNNYSPDDVVSHIETLSGEPYNLSDKEIAKQLGKTAGYVSQHRTYARLIAEIRVLVANGTLKFREVRSLGALPPEEQMRWLHQRQRQPNKERTRMASPYMPRKGVLYRKPAEVSALRLSYKRDDSISQILAVFDGFLANKLDKQQFLVRLRAFKPQWVTLPPNLAELPGKQKANKQRTVKRPRGQRQEIAVKRSKRKAVPRKAREKPEEK